MHLETATHNLVKLEGAELVAAVRADFNLDIKNPEKIVRGTANQVYKAELRGETIFIRINKNSRELEAEILGYEVLRKLEIPVPALVSYQAQPLTIGYPTMIITAVEGVPLRDAQLLPEKEKEVYTDAGGMLKKMHNIKLPGFGELISVGGELQGRHKTYQEYRDALHAHEQKGIDYLLGKNLISEDEAESIRKNNKEIDGLNVESAAFLHRDFSPGHVFVNGGKISGVIDLGTLMAGDPRLDIATSFIFIKGEKRNFLKEGYGQLAYDPVIMKYLVNVATRKAAHRSKHGYDEGSTRALEALREALTEIRGTQ
jgi:aminoglycoside phosphotransferase (APT) family kinase protein